jgi:hypothetical protein
MRFCRRFSALTRKISIQKNPLWFCRKFNRNWWVWLIMKKNPLIILLIVFLMIFSVSITGCTQSTGTLSQTSNLLPTTPGQQTTTPWPTASSTHETSWNGNFATINQFYFADCTHTIDTTNMEKLQGVYKTCEDGSEVPLVLRPGMSSPSYDSTPTTTPPYTDNIMQNDPIIGTYVFDPSQFKTVDVERMDYFSRAGSLEYDTVVPLDISPDIKWTFRDDGILLFYQNNINCNLTTSYEDHPRCAWQQFNGAFLRNGTWKKIESENGVNKYQITRKKFAFPLHEYTVIYDKNGIRLTQPNSLNMTKIN